jgi:hypothetical protein
MTYNLEWREYKTIPVDGKENEFFFVPENEPEFLLLTDNVTCA